MNDEKENLVTLKIAESDREWVYDEQARIRKAGRDEPTQAELFKLLRALYQRTAGDAPRLTQTPARAIPANLRWHQMLDEILADPKERGGIEKNLEWAAAAVRAKQPRGPRHPASRAKRASSS